MDDVRPNPMFVHEVMEGVSRLCPFWIDVAESLNRDQVYVSAGQYTVTPDDKPIIGPHPEIEGLYFNTGYSGHGIMGTPGGGRLLADLVTGHADDETNPFSFRRLAALEAAGAGTSDCSDLKIAIICSGRSRTSRAVFIDERPAA